MSMMYSGCAFQIGNYILLVSVEELRIKSDSLKTKGIVFYSLGHFHLMTWMTMRSISQS